MGRILKECPLGLAFMEELILCRQGNNKVLFFSLPSLYDKNAILLKGSPNQKQLVILGCCS